MGRPVAEPRGRRLPDEDEPRFALVVVLLAIAGLAAVFQWFIGALFCRHGRGSLIGVPGQHPARPAQPVRARRRGGGGARAGPRRWPPRGVA